MSKKISHINKGIYNIKFTHTEDTMKALAHAQYDLFCKTNYIIRSLVSIACIVIGVYKLDQWWSYLLIAYGAFLFTGKYNQANHTVKKIVQGIKDANLDFPSSEYVFEENVFRVYSLPDGAETDAIEYEKITRLGMDRENFYIFRNRAGGYVIPRTELGDHEDEFMAFLKDKSGQIIFSKYTPPAKQLFHTIKKRFS